MACADQFAGTIEFDIAGFTGNSNDIDDPTMIFLCEGDNLQINHNEDEDLTGDPQTLTDPGITYAFYAGVPTVTGPDLETILTDPFLIPNPAGGAESPFFVTGGTGEINGDILLQNTGALQDLPIFGTPGEPVQVWFAPITIDEFATNSYEEDNGVTGPCVNANIDEFFSVVFLNELELADFTIDPDVACEASFTLNGGLPQFDGTDYQSISIALQGDPTVTGNIDDDEVSHGETVSFSVLQPGIYDVTVTDEKGCTSTFSIDFPVSNPLPIEASTETVPPGSPVCVEITASDFDNIVSLQTSINYDETMLTFSSFENLNPNLPGLSGSLFDNGTLVNLSWFDPAAQGITLGDNVLLFEICFDVIGTGGDVSPIAFDESGAGNEVTNSTNCGDIGLVTTDGSVTITIESFGVDVDGEDVSCSGANDGSFTVTASGGQAPFTINWTGQNTGTVGGPATINTDGGSFTTSETLEPDDYDVVVSDALGNVVNATVTIAEGFGFAANTDYTAPTCPGDCDGQITASLFSAGGPITPGSDYTFLWSTGDMTQTITDLCPAVPQVIYSVTVTGPNGCTAQASETAIGPAPIMPNADITPATCSGAGDGAIMLNITGGAGGYTIDWASPTIPDNSSNINGLNDDIYEVEISDMNMCADTFFIVVDAVKVLNIDETILGLDCDGDTDGSITVVASTSGGTSNSYTFNWLGTPPPSDVVSNANTSTASNLGEGIYQVFLTDDDNCSVNETYNLTAPEVIEIALFETVSETCGGNDGGATVTVTGGVYPYMYDWGVPGQTDSIATNLAAGDYVLSVTDANGCESTFDVTIDEPTPPVITALDDDTVNCETSNDGQLTVEFMPGGSPITGVEWDNGETTNTISGLTPGEYIVTVTAQDGCTAIDTALVIAPPPLSLTDIVVTQTDCPGSAGGSIQIILAGGTTPYIFDWTGPDGMPIANNSAVLADRTAGTYNVIVNDVFQCDTLELEATITEPPSIVGTFTNIEMTSCSDSNDGAATVTPNYEDDPGNTQMQDFNFTWIDFNDPTTPTTLFTENGVLQSTTDNLPAGEIIVLVSDGQCFDTLFLNVPAPAPLTATGTAVNVSCFGDTDGSLEVIGTGGTAPYNYNWSTGDVDVTFVENLPPGQVIISVIDANNCTFGFAATIEEPEPFEVIADMATTIDSVSCFMGEDAVLSVFTTGGNTAAGGLTYDWEGGIAESTQSIAENVPNGSWSVTVTDIKGCTDDFTFLVTQPEPIDFEFSFDTIQCNGEDAEFRIDTVTGGTVDSYFEYNYRVNNNPNTFSVTQAIDLEADDYIVSVFDGNGCEVQDSFTLTQPNPLLVQLPELIEVELGDTTTQLLPVILNDFPLDSIRWTPAGAGLSNDTILNPFVRNSMDDQSYTLTVVDANGCVGAATVDVEIDRNRNVYIPNVFSPNNDGRNDEFGVFGCLGVTRIVSAVVFDRWGNQMAATPPDGLMPECLSPNGAVIWDGTFRGKPVDNGVFVYAIDIEFLDGARLTYRGDVTVVR